MTTKSNDNKNNNNKNDNNNGREGEEGALSESLSLSLSSIDLFVLPRLHTYMHICSVAILLMSMMMVDD
jgi:hypothetical protein